VSPRKTPTGDRADLVGHDGGAGGVVEDAHRIVCHLDELLREREMTLVELAERAGVTVVNLSVLKNDRARAVRFTTLTAVCDVLQCQPGDVLSLQPQS
jgi:putative transcriptional regulator